jgi:hypothetical protein
MMIEHVESLQTYIYKSYGESEKTRKDYIAHIPITEDLADIIEEWLYINDEWEEQEEVSSQIQPYRKRSEDIKISDQSES